MAGLTLIKLSYNNTEISYILTRKRVKNINLRVTPKGTFVSASKLVPQKKIDEFILSKAEWILSAQEKFLLHRDIQPAAIEYQDGDIIYLLGNPLVLRLSVGSKEEISNDEGFVFLQVKDKENLNRKIKLVDQWKTQKCIELFTKLSDEVYARFYEYKVPYPQLKFREMTSRWGSCQVKKGIITLNKKLLEKPYAAIEYVVVHEYAHFIVPNHSKKFYELVEEFLPDYRARKKML